MARIWPARARQGAILLGAVLGLVLSLFGPAQASAVHGVSSQVLIEPGRKLLDVIPLKDGRAAGLTKVKPPHDDERWFQVADSHGNPGFVPYWTTPGGSPMVPDTSMVIAAVNDCINCGTQGLTFDSNHNLYVTLAGGSATLNLPFAGNADAQTGTANGQAVGLMIWNGASWDRVQGTSGAINVTVTNGITANPTQNTEYYSGVCFQLSGQSASTCPTVSGLNGCTAVNHLPCFWDVGGTFGASLVGHTLYGFQFHSGQSMQQLNVQMVCLDTATGTFTGTNLVLGDTTNGTEMGVDQVVPVGGSGGRKIVAGLVCELFAITGNTPLTSPVSVGAWIR